MTTKNFPLGPKGLPFFQSLQFCLQPFKYMDKWGKKYGVPFSAKFMGYGNYVFFSNPKHIQEIFMGPPHIFHSGGANKELFERAVGPSSAIVLDGDPHKKLRKILMPLFHGDYLSKNLSDKILNISKEEIMSWPLNTPVKLEPHIRKLTMDIMLQVIFGVEDEADQIEFGKVFQNYLHNSQKPLTVFAMGLPAWLLKSSVQWFMATRRQRLIDKALYKFIRKRREQGDLENKSDILSLLLQSKHEDGRPLSDQELRDQLFTLVFAGFDTTTAALEWAVHDIFWDETVIKKLRLELNEKFDQKNEKVDYAGIKSLKYLNAAIIESLRLHPVVPIVSRSLTEDYTIGDVCYPTGTVLVPSIYLTHHNPQIYENPKSFQLERFLDKRPKPNEWFPFGGSNRACIGMAFSILEMKVVLSTLIRHFDIKLSYKPHQVKEKRKGILAAPSDATHATLKKIKSL